MGIIVIGIDLAKDVFAVHGADETGKAALVRPCVKQDVLSEFGIVLPQKGQVVRREAGPHQEEVPGWVNTVTALLASIGNGHDLKCCRQIVAWHGLVPGQYSSGGKQRLGRIAKAGDSYLRNLLILGARVVLASCKNKTDRLGRWSQSVAERRGYWKAVVAVAAKNARMAWAMLSKGESFKPVI